MDLDPDELAGVCDLFGALTREELTVAVEELAFRRGVDFEREAHDAAVESAREAYVLVVLGESVADALADAGADVDPPLVAPGPRAFPVVPDGGTDLPHILDVPRRDVPDAAVERAVRARLAAEVAALDDDADDERAARLLDVTYDAELLTGGDFSRTRAMLDGGADGDDEDDGVA